MKVVYESAALKALSRMPIRDSKALRSKLRTYAETGVGDVTRLVSCPGEWRLRHGDWRAVFIIEGDIVVIKIAHRREIYR
jgi:mRNA interferase RelE/StbE